MPIGVKSPRRTTLEAYFDPWIAYGFTTGMEADLDRVAEGAMAYEGVLGSFWGDFEQALGTAAGLARDEVRATVETALERYIFAASPGSPVERACPSCADGQLRLKFGRHGPFVGCPNYPECRYSRPLGVNPADSGSGSEPVPLGTDPDTGLALTLRRGRYSRYVQLGDNDADGRAPRGTVPASMEPHEITQDVARAPRYAADRRRASRYRQDHPGGDRTLRLLAQARRGLPSAARRRGRARDRPQPGRRAGGCEAGLNESGVPEQFPTPPGDNSAEPPGPGLRSFDRR